MLFTDSANAEKNRHIDTRYKWVIEQVTKGVFKVDHIPGTKMVADGLTKPLGKEKHSQIAGNGANYNCAWRLPRDKKLQDAANPSSLLGCNFRVLPQLRKLRQKGSRHRIFAIPGAVSPSMFREGETQTMRVPKDRTHDVNKLPNWVSPSRGKGTCWVSTSISTRNKYQKIRYEDIFELPITFNQ